jgi:hypothetical protein
MTQSQNIEFKQFWHDDLENVSKALNYKNVQFFI